ncbi:DDB1- and CUL4-associated factor 8-like isoform X2 [Hordeum vulgare subsp. vulgare]|uniref:DDB1- and CUL4-associated factor 8-like isoform X2 n=1 Tax=Hordeum vulgare subsp. vulgare TaxID=112509 RepID=UPI001D1A4A68|nr:DDB1- and CUL4-associated factor 8-like isoform X2 [Hordeum vulgare subsp. vulgare]
MPAKGTRMAELWGREVGRLRPKRFADSVKASQDFVNSLGIQKRLREHRGGVNTISFNSNGSLLLSGSDDRTVVLWDWVRAKPAVQFHTGHENNVLHAQFMPLSDDRSIVTCGGDGEVRYAQIDEAGRVYVDQVVEMAYEVHRLAVEQGNPNTFYSSGQDGYVWRFDLRGKHARELFKVGVVYDDGENDAPELYAIAVDPRNPYHVAVSGSDEFVRLYDTRKYLHGDFGCPVDYFCPPGLITQNKDGITGLAFSQTGEILASYSWDNIYLFEREHGLHFNGFKVGEMPLLGDGVGAGLPLYKDILPEPKVFMGHRNKQSIKGVNFLGPNCDYVASGSDCGHVFIWRKKDGVLMRAMKGDKRIVNCVEQHPSEIVVASSGFATDIKIWAPGDCENPSTVDFDEDTFLFSSMSSDDSDISDLMDDFIIGPSGSGSSDNDEEDDDDDDEDTDDDDDEDDDDDDEDEGDEEEDEEGVTTDGDSGGEDGDEGGGTEDMIDD